MKSEQAHSEIRSALRAELKRRHGQIGQIEAAMDRSEGYLSRFCRGDMEISLKGLLDALEILEIEPGSFFGSSLGGVCTPVTLLRRHEGTGRFHKDLSGIEETLVRVAEGDVEPTDPKRLHQVCLDDFLEQSLSVQLRRLRSSKKYRQPDFALALLRHIDKVRYEDPAGSARLCASVIESILPRLDLPRSERIDLVCTALAVLSSALRLMGEFRSALRAARLGLELSEAESLERAQVELLERGSYAFGAIGEHDTALFVLRRALEISVDLEDEILTGRVQVARGVMYSHLGKIEKSRMAFRQALSLLPEEDASITRWRFASFQSLAVLAANQRDLDSARKWLAKAVDSFEQEGGINYAKLLWQKGSIDLADSRYGSAEESLRSAYRIFEKLESPEFPLVSIDLIKALSSQGKRKEAVDFAKKMAALVGNFEQSRVLEAAILEFLRIVLQDQLTESVLDEYRERLAKLAMQAGRARQHAPHRQA